MKRKKCKYCDGFLDEIGSIQCGALHNIEKEMKEYKTLTYNQKTFLKNVDKIIKERGEKVLPEFFADEPKTMKKMFEDGYTTGYETGYRFELTKKGKEFIRKINKTSNNY